MKSEIKTCYDYGYEEALLKGKDPFDLIKTNLINNEKLNRYRYVSCGKMKFQKCDFPLSGYETFGDQTGILKELGENYKNMTLEEIYDKLSQYFNEI